MEVVELLKELIKRPSVTPNECGIYEIIKAELADFQAIECDKNGVKNLFLYKDFGVNSTHNIESTHPLAPSAREGEEKADSVSAESREIVKETTRKIHLCFAGHIDVVPAGNGWSISPFEAAVKNGVLYGRGAQDMKGGVACFISALKAVREFGGILSVLLTSDEEGDGIFGTKIMLDELKKRDLLPHFAIVAEPTCEKKLGDSVKIGRRGSINGVLKIFGTQGHAAYPHKCVNPAHLIAPILAQIAGHNLDSGDLHFAPSKIVITDIRAGIEATNVTPSELKLMFNVRNNPLTDKSAIKKYIESLLKNAGIKNYDLTLNQGSFPFITDSKILLDSLVRVIKKHTKLTPRPNTEGGTSDARYFSAFGVEVVEFGLVNDRIHAVDECVKLRDIEVLRNIFVDFISDFNTQIKFMDCHENPTDSLAMTKINCHDLHS